MKKILKSAAQKVVALLGLNRMELMSEQSAYPVAFLFNHLRSVINNSKGLLSATISTAFMPHGSDEEVSLVRVETRFALGAFCCDGGPVDCVFGERAGLA